MALVLDCIDGEKKWNCPNLDTDNHFSTITEISCQNCVLLQEVQVYQMYNNIWRELNMKENITQQNVNQYHGRNTKKKTEYPSVQAAEKDYKYSKIGSKNPKEP